MIEEALLISFGAKSLELNKDEYIFTKGDVAKYYYQVVEGEVKMNNYSDDGKEFIQAIFSKERSFGEPPLFGDFGYPANAITITKVVLLRLAKDAFFELLELHPRVSIQFAKGLAERLNYKAIMAAEISTQDSGHRILTFIDYLKNEIYKVEGEFAFKLELTRQQIADLTGLRVETVIRTMKELEKDGELKIKSRKVWR